MKIKTTEITVNKPDKDVDFFDITGNVSDAVTAADVKEGIANVFSPGSTASVTTIEYEPNLLIDFRKVLERLVPSDIRYEHEKAWGERNGQSHMRTSIFGPGVVIPIHEGKLMTGQWQQIVVMDFDVIQRNRRVVIQVIGE
ncbi:MAG: secondary thiamine-phosphate synthase enzyme YjbQ [Candidatus Micrarchaeaceae archaeon]